MRRNGNFLQVENRWRPGQDMQAVRPGAVPGPVRVSVLEVPGTGGCGGGHLQEAFQDRSSPCHLPSPGAIFAGTSGPNSGDASLLDHVSMP